MRSSGYRPGLTYGDGYKRGLADARGAPQAAEERRCRKCRRETKSEEALVNGQIWCHACADDVPQASADKTLAQALYEAECYGIGATSDTNQRVILQAAKELAALRARPQAASLTDETIQTLLDLLNPLHGELDRQTYDEKLAENFDPPRDREYNVDITARMENDLTQAVLILENRRASVKTNPPQTASDDLVQLLREGPADSALAFRAADEIERLRANSHGSVEKAPSEFDVNLMKERDKWRDLAQRLAKQHEPYIPMFPSDEARRRTVSGALLDEIYALSRPLRQVTDGDGND